VSVCERGDDTSEALRGKARTWTLDYGHESVAVCLADDDVQSRWLAAHPEHPIHMTRSLVVWSVEAAVSQQKSRPFNSSLPHPFFTSASFSIAPPFPSLPHPPLPLPCPPLSLQARAPSFASPSRSLTAPLLFCSRHPPSFPLTPILSLSLSLAILLPCLRPFVLSPPPSPHPNIQLTRQQYIKPRPHGNHQRPQTAPFPEPLRQ
jgi:hypothetical protein